MATILFLDDTETSSGHMASGCQHSLTKHGFRCIFERGLSRVGGGILPTAAKLGNRIVKRAQLDSVDGLVIDLCWADRDWDGVDAWLEAKKQNLQVEQSNVLFCTQRLWISEARSRAAELGFSDNQFVLKNSQGSAMAVEWFCSRFGDPVLSTNP